MLRQDNSRHYKQPTASLRPLQKLARVEMHLMDEQTDSKISSKIN